MREVRLALDKSEDVLANEGVKTRLSYWTIRGQVSQLEGSKTRISSWTNQRMFSQWEGSKTIGYLLDQSEDVLASDVFLLKLYWNHRDHCKWRWICAQCCIYYCFIYGHIWGEHY